MEITPFTWLLVIFALILGFWAGHFKFQPKAPPEIYPGKTFGISSRDDKGNPTIPVTGGTVNFTDESNNEFQIQVPKQDPPREITFWREDAKAKDLKDEKQVPNPSHEPVSRIIIQLKAKDAYGDVESFNPMMTTIAKYTPEDLTQDHVKGNPDKLIRFYHNGKRWIRLSMPDEAINRSDQKVTAYVASFSSCGI